MGQRRRTAGGIGGTGGHLHLASGTTIESQALKSNMLGDPPVRVVDVYVPAGYEGQGLPLLVAIGDRRVVGVEPPP